jgi:hypothetical protein
MRIFLILFILVSTSANSQTILKGRVIDSSDKSVIKYVNISIKNKNKGTSSDKNGNFNINFDKFNDTLIFSCIGYKKIELFSFKSDTIEINMLRDTIALNEIEIKPIIKKCKKIKLSYNQSKINSVLFEGTIIRRKVKINSKYLCGFGFEIISNYDTNIIVRPYFTNDHSEQLLFNDYVIEEELKKKKLTKIKFNFKENLLLEEDSYYIGLEILSIPNNNNYVNNVQIICSDDSEKNTDVISIYNFIQQDNLKMNFDKTLDYNIKLEIISSK